MNFTRPQRLGSLLVALLILATASEVNAQQKRKVEPVLEFPPKLPGGQDVVTDKSDKFLQKPDTLRDGVAVAKTPPTVDFLYYSGQNYEGKPWSNWGDGTVADGKYYSGIGDHMAIGGRSDGENGVGTGFVCEYDPEQKTLRNLVDIAELLNMPEGHYVPSKVHSRVDMGSDGWLYFATHRGSPRATTDEYHYKGDWILRTNPKTGESEVVVHAPVPDHAIPNSVLDPDRLIFYGGTAASIEKKDEGIVFFSYDCKNKKLLYSGPDGPARYMIFAPSSGCVYYVPNNDIGQLMRFDPDGDRKPVPVKGAAEIGIRAATAETADGNVYTVATGQRAADATIWVFNTKTEKAKEIGTAAVGTQAYVASIDVDPTGRYLYYCPGAHGGSPKDGTPVVQFDVKTGKKKVLAFLDPFYTDKYGLTLKGTYSTAVDPAGDKLYITWNVSRGSRAWDCCGLTVVHIPESERSAD